MFRRLITGFLVLLQIVSPFYASGYASLRPSGTALDYAKAENWAYTRTEETEKAADVFFIAPASVQGGEGVLQADLSNETERNQILKSIGMQSDLYGRYARFFAPLYRQSTYQLWREDSNSSAVLESKEIAYQDVKAAFLYYLNNYNNGRPFIIAGYSQGAEIGLRLIKEISSDKRLYRKMIAAYLIGWRVTESDLRECRALKMARGETDTGVIITFECESEVVNDTIVVPAGTFTYSINPLNWRTDSTLATKDMNLGYVYPAADGSVKQEIPNLCGAYIDPVRGTLKVTDITPEEYPPRMDLFPSGSYHIYDYEFFYRNVQENTGKRINAFLRKQADCG